MRPTGVRHFTIHNWPKGRFLRVQRPARPILNSELPDPGLLWRRGQHGLGLVEEGLRFGVFGLLRLFHDLAEASQQGRGSVRVAELVLDHREERHVGRLVVGWELSHPSAKDYLYWATATGRWTAN